MSSTPYVSREAAGLRPPKSTPSHISASHLTGHYAGPSPWGPGGIGDHNRCATIWRGFQAYHMDHNGWSDIAYSSGVCPHGFRFEGRGPGARTAANGTNAGNAASLATCYIAGVGDPLTLEARLAFLDEEARFGVPLDKAHRDWKSTACPGQELADWIHAGHPVDVLPPNIPAPGPIDRPAVDLAGIANAIRVAKRRTWRRGDRGDGVKFIQAGINAISGRGLAVDGVFGAGTDAAVRDLQRWFHLGVDGIVGPVTWSLLYPGI